MLLEDASFVNPQDVASIEVLKDASATASAIIGNPGANGVIIITTKRGQEVYGSHFVQFVLRSAADREKLCSTMLQLMYNELKGNNHFPTRRPWAKVPTG